MGMLGFMNVLAIEGISKNIRKLPGSSHETRLIGTIPGRDVNPDNPDLCGIPKW